MTTTPTYRLKDFAVCPEGEGVFRLKHKDDPCEFRLTMELIDIRAFVNAFAITEEERKKIRKLLDDLHVPE